MKILEWMQKGKLTERNLENMDIEEQDDKVIIPKWQFALLYHAFYEYRRSNLIYAGMVLVLVVAMLYFSIW